jgi:hypothetical protein
MERDPRHERQESTVRGDKNGELAAHQRQVLTVCAHLQVETLKPFVQLLDC